MPDFVFLNGEYVAAEEAKISVFDHGFLYGDGLFETMRAYNGKIFLLAEHLDRLLVSARLLELSLPWTREYIERALNQIIALNGRNLYIRLTVSRGPGPIGIDPQLCANPTIVITSREIKYNERLYRDGARAIFVKTIRNLAGATPPEIKSLNFLNNILAKQEAARAGVDEGFMLNNLGQVTEGTVSNIFMVKHGLVFTPSLESGILSGVTRSKVIDLAGEHGISIEQKILLKEDFTGADEVFYTNSGTEVVPVTWLDGEPVGSGRPGQLTLKLLNYYRYNVLSTG